MDVDLATRNNLLAAGESGYNYNQYVYRGDDNKIGSPEADSFTGSKGNDTIDGGDDLNVIDFPKFSSAVSVNLDTGKAITSFGTSTLVNVEDMEGTKYNDTLIGNNLNNTLKGDNGNDILNARAGNDNLIGGKGKDILTSHSRSYWTIGFDRFYQKLTAWWAKQHHPKGDSPDHNIDLKASDLNFSLN